MRKVVAAINVTLDGFCDHTAVNPDEEMHAHYADLMRNGGVALFGRITYQLMEFWKGIVENPSGEKAMDDFAVSIHKIEKVVFSHTLTNADWENARIATRSPREEVMALREQEGGDILISSRSLIVALLEEGLIDEFQLMVHPVIAGGGLPLFDALKNRMELRIINTKLFPSGAVILYISRAPGA